MDFLLKFDFIRWLLSSNSGGIMTALSVLAVIWIYFSKQRSYKRNAARILLMEIRNAEKNLRVLKHSTNFDSFFSVLPTNSWSKYAHLFVNDFNQDDLDYLDNFYRKCSLVEEELARINSFLNISIIEKAKVVQRKLADAICVGEPAVVEKQKSLILEEYIDNEVGWFDPKTPKKKIVDYLKGMPNIINNPVGHRLKKLAGVRS